METKVVVIGAGLLGMVMLHQLSKDGYSEKEMDCVEKGPEDGLAGHGGLTGIGAVPAMSPHVTYSFDAHVGRSGVATGMVVVPKVRLSR